MPAIWIAWLRRIPIIVNYRGGGAETFLSHSAAQVRFTMRRATVLALPSGFLLDIFSRHGMPGQILPNIINISRFHPSENNDKRGTTKSLNICITRNLEPIYGLDTAIRAFKMIHSSIPQARLFIAGTGYQANELAYLSVSLNIERLVTFTGRLDPDQMANLYRNCDLSINPSNIDNMPNSVLEALASGIPVVSTRVGGVPYILEDEKTALLIPSMDPSAMAKAAMRIFYDQALRKRLVTNGLEEVKRYHWDNIRENLRDLYESSMVRTTDKGGLARKSS
nr:glycosyltransferase family 4 protein [Thiorhodococcus mannitoliphagus]